MKKLILPLVMLLLLAVVFMRAWIFAILPVGLLAQISYLPFWDRSDKSIIAENLYSKGDASDAKRLWEDIVSTPKKDTFARDGYFNLGNLAFEFGMTRKEVDDQILNLLEAKLGYEKSLEIESTPEAKANIEAVIKLLEKLQKKQEEQKKSEESKDAPPEKSDQDSGSGSASDNADQDTTEKPKDPKEQKDPKDTGKSWSEKSDKPSKTGSGSESGSGTSQSTDDPSGTQKKSGFTNKWQTQWLGRDFGTSTGASLNPSERAQLDDTLTRIRDLQQKRSEFTRPDGTKGTAQSPNLFEQFLRNDPLFQDIQNGWAQKRDW